MRTATTGVTRAATRCVASAAAEVSGRRMAAAPEVTASATAPMASAARMRHHGAGRHQSAQNSNRQTRSSLHECLSIIRAHPASVQLFGIPL
jgi:hypothetical protein